MKKSDRIDISGDEIQHVAAFRWVFGRRKLGRCVHCSTGHGSESVRVCARRVLTQTHLKSPRIYLLNQQIPISPLSQRACCVPTCEAVTLLSLSLCAPTGEGGPSLWAVCDVLCGLSYMHAWCEEHTNTYAMYIIHLVCAVSVVGVVRVMCVVLWVESGGSKNTDDGTPVRRKVFRFGARCGVI